MKRLAVVLLVLLVALPVLVLLAAGAIVNSGPARTALLDAIQRATGHEARIAGPVGVAWSLVPSVSIDGLTLLNPPGFGRPELLTVRRVEAAVAPLPLLWGRVEVRRVSLVGPDLVLERDAAGRGNWERPPVAPTAPTPAPAAQRSRMAVDVRAVQVSDGRFEWRGRPAVAVPALTLAPGGGPVRGQVVVNGVTLALSGRTDAPTADGIRFDIAATGGGLALSLAGSSAPGAEMTARLEAADLAAAGALAGQALPPLRNVVATVQAKAAGQGGDRPVQVTASASLGALPITATLTAARLTAPLPIQAQLGLGAATATLDGTVDPASRTATLTIAARIPALQPLGAAAGLALPALTDMAVDARVLPAPNGADVLLRGLKLTSAQGDLAGDVAIGTGARPSLRGSLISQMLDLDAWTNLPAVAAGPPPSTAPPAQTPAPTASPPPPQWMIPDRPLPLAILLRADADLRVSAAQVQVHGASYRSLEARVLLQDGRLRLDPASVVSPGGAVQMAVQVDASAAPPTVSLLLRGPALDAAGLSAALGRPGALTGAADIDADLHATGATPHAMAATLTGHLVLAMTDGDIENAVLATVLAPALRSAGLGFDATGRSRIRCIGLRVDVAEGQASMPILALDTTRLRLEGDGRLDLGQETLDLHLRPTARLGPTSVAIPLTLTGPFRSPRAQLEKGAIAPGRFGISIGGAATDPCARLADLHATSVKP